MSQNLPDTYIVYVANAADGDIASFRFDTASGQLEARARYPAAPTVMPLALTADRATLYAATRGDAPSIVRYTIDAATGALSRRHTASIVSSHAYLCADPAGRYLLGASYGEHLASAYEVDADGNAIGEPAQVVSDIAHAHAVITSPDARFAYVSSLGADKVRVFALGAASEMPASKPPLTPVQEVSLETGFGPRHIRLSPDATKLYVLSEFRATVAVFDRDAHTGQLRLHSVSPRPATLAHLVDGHARPHFTDPIQPDPAILASWIWAADIHVTPDNAFVYVSERTTSRLICYRVAADGTLDYVGFTDTETQPRGFRIDPSGRFLVACGEKSSQISAYTLDPHTGALTLCSRCAGGKGANWVEIVGIGGTGGDVSYTGPTASD